MAVLLIIPWVLRKYGKVVHNFYLCQRHRKHRHIIFHTYGCTGCQCFPGSYQVEPAMAFGTKFKPSFQCDTITRTGLRKTWKMPAHRPWYEPGLKVLMPVLFSRFRSMLLRTSATRLHSGSLSSLLCCRFGWLRM